MTVSYQSALTVQDGIDHIKHELGNLPSSEIDATELISNAYQVLTTMHRWRFLERNSVALPLESGVSQIPLPLDFETPLSIEGDGDIIRHLEFVDLNRLHQARRWNATPNTGYHYAAVIHKVPTPRNLLLNSEQLDASDWTEVNASTVTVTANVATSPVDGTASVVDRVIDSSASSIGTLEQVIPVHLAPTGDYFAEIIMRPVTSAGVLQSNPTKTFFSLETPSPTDSGLQSLIEIKWGAEPWRDAPTVYMVAASTDAAPTSNTGKGTTITPVPYGEGFYGFQIRGYEHSLAQNYGRINCRLAPAAALFGSDDGETSVVPFDVGVEVVRVQVAQGRFNVPYVVNTTSVVTPTVPRPFLEIHPAAASDLDQPFTMFYTSGPAEFELATDEIPIPSYCKALFIEIVRALASGWEDSDEASATLRLEQIEASRLFKRAKIRDGLTVPSLGQMRGGIGGHHIWETGLATNVAGPKAAGT